MEAFKGKEEPRLSVIKMLKSEIGNAELDKKSELTNEEVLEIVMRSVKKRKDAAGIYEKEGREDLASTEKAELEVLSAYLPEQLSEDEVKDLVKKAIEQTGAAEAKDLGKVMGVLASQTKGKADGVLVSKIVREFLS